MRSASSENKIGEMIFESLTEEEVSHSYGCECASQISNESTGYGMACFADTYTTKVNCKNIKSGICTTLKKTA